ncbi:hypothetical protein CAPTEDRAFT_207507 [Capitella teleta]|uniref:Uncharacterized protein n=1 Tax=Capitella teleta TaxID=283909 RepID=R7U3S2_CAPTE|nr:hypothetical protein CAPTEDRAFT_207507 [Capitella teleta]|eukprot:ELU00644.1 hypothetical protein CAPTEDRAFT_207507 [Capitella teleta]
MESSVVNAISKGFFQQVRFLVELGLNVNEREASTGRTPLCALALLDSSKWAISMARLLIEHGARIGMRDKRGLNAFHYAVIYERTKLMSIYLRAIDFNVNQGDMHGNTALHHAAASGNVESVHLILNTLIRYKMTVHQVNQAGATALAHALELGQVECAMLIKDMTNPAPPPKNLMHMSMTSSNIDKQSTFHGSRSTTEEAHPDDEEAKGEDEDREKQEAEKEPSMQKSCSSLNSQWERSPPSRSRNSQSETLSFLNPQSSSISSLYTGGHHSSHQSIRSKTFITRPKSSISSNVSSVSRRTKHSASKVPHPASSRIKNKPPVHVPQVFTKHELCKQAPLKDAVEHTRNKLEYLYQMSVYDDLFKENNVDLTAYVRHHQQQQHKQFQQDQHDARSVASSTNGHSDWRRVMRNLYSAYDFQFSSSFRETAKASEVPGRPASPFSDCVSESQADRTSVCTTSASKKIRKLSAVMRAAQKKKKNSSKNTPDSAFADKHRIPCITTDLADDVSEVSAVTSLAASELAGRGRGKWAK